MKSLIAALVVTCFIHLLAVAQENPVASPAANPASLVDRFADLSAEEQTTLSDSIQRKELKRLSPEQRLALQKAAVRYSEQVLGRDANGNLKVVKNEIGKQLLKIAGDYLHNLPPGEVPAHAAAQAIYGSIPLDATAGHRHGGDQSATSADALNWFLCGSWRSRGGRSARKMDRIAD